MPASVCVSHTESERGTEVAPGEVAGDCLSMLAYTGSGGSSACERSERRKETGQLRGPDQASCHLGKLSHSLPQFRRLLPNVYLAPKL